MKEFLIEKTVVYETIVKANSEEDALLAAKELHLDNFDYAETVATEVFELEENGDLVI